MSFKFPHLALLSVSVISLSVLSGCSGLNGASNQSASSASASDPFDTYYGSPKPRQAQTNTYRTKIERIDTRKKASSFFKKTAPKRYVVKKGDTLWGISNLFLKNPSYWPEIWDVNQKVSNPHRIYPGDVLYIYEGGRQKVNVAGGGSVLERIVPQMRIERNGRGKPISTLAPFLAWPRVLDNDTINNAPYIVGSNEASMLLEAGQTVFTNMQANRYAGRYAIFHKGKAIIDPETHENFGYQVNYNGFLEVKNPISPAGIGSAHIDESSREIRIGDRLLSAKMERQSLDAPITMPNRRIRGSVISLVDANLVSGQSMIITINKGARNGIKAGYTVGVYSPGKTVNDPYAKAANSHFWEANKSVSVTLPPNRVATAIVYKVLNNISYALISEANNAVKTGYRIGNP